MPLQDSSRPTCSSSWPKPALWQAHQGIIEGQQQQRHRHPLHVGKCTDIVGNGPHNSGSVHCSGGAGSIW